MTYVSAGLGADPLTSKGSTFPEIIRLVRSTVKVFRTSHRSLLSQKDFAPLLDWIRGLVIRDLCLSYVSEDVSAQRLK